MHIDDEESHSASATASAGLMKFSEVKGDLFSCPPTSSLAHCVSEDMAMGKGVAVLFKKEFGGVGELKAQGTCVATSEFLVSYWSLFIAAGVKPGGVAVLKRKDRYVYYLVCDDV
jgi:hypothetical protein